MKRGSERRAATRLAAAGVLAASLFSAAPSPAGQAATERLVVLDASERQVDAALGDAGEVLRRDDALGFTVVETTDPGALRARFGDRVVADPIAHAASVDSYFAAQWGPIEIGMPAAWTVEDGSAAVRVAIVDSGLAAHVDLAGTPVENGTDYVDGDAPTDLNGHGTHVAGTIAAVRGNVNGVAGMAVATLIPIRVLDANSSGFCSNFASGVNEAVQRGAHIVNLSLYCNSDFAPLRTAIENAWGQGVLPVVAAGNFAVSSPSRCVTFPARYASAFAVGATTVAAQRASFSCTGAEVDIAAPGDTILSTVLGNGYAFYSGTSMAAPHVAGAAALMKAQNPGMSMAAIRSTLEATATDLGLPGHDNEFGHGLVDPYDALT